MSISDESVEAACEAFYNDPSGLTSWERLSQVSPDTADRYRAAMTRALEVGQVIPDAAVEAAAKVLWDKEMVAAWGKFPATFHAPFLRDARAALEAAVPHMLSREREETRLAHLDAVVNRETKREELAEAWADGHESGFWNGRVSQLNIPYGAPIPDIGAEHEKATNPYKR
jgi:hypothetical protein